MNYTDVIIILAAYLLGAVPFSVLFSRALGLTDPREFGSGNPGATNVARQNKFAAGLTLVADTAKGAVLPALWIADHPMLAAATGAAAVCGHVFSVFLRFRGGKGVATSLGVFVVWHWPAGAVAVAVWILMFAAFRMSSLASLAALTTGAATLWFAADVHPAVGLAGIGITALSAWRHRQNIANLIKGRENTFAKPSPTRPFIARMLVAAVALGGLLTLLGTVHDYPQTRRQIEKIRSGDIVAVQRPWIASFFFFNEAGSGIKYFLTGNPEHMRHYPSNAYILSRLSKRAYGGEWRAQSTLARQLDAQFDSEQAKQKALMWMRRARGNAPVAEHAEMSRFIHQLETQLDIGQHPQTVSSQ